MEYKEFCKETMKDLLKYPKEWSVTKGLVDKVMTEGVFRNFYGDTTVFKLKSCEICELEKIQRDLLDGFEDKVVKLEPKTFHLTLQSISNSYTTLYGGIEEINKEVKHNKELMKKAFDEIASKYSSKKIRMKVVGLCLSSNGITVLSTPLLEEDYKILIDSRGILEKYDYHEAKEVGIYVPHISLCYFRPIDQFSNYEELKERVFQMSKKINDMDIEIVLEVNRLAYQYHHNMNDFRDIFKVKEF